MACRCERIKRNANDISRIMSAEEAIRALMKIESEQDARLSELCESMMEMATPDNIDACVAAIRAMNKGSRFSTDVMVNKCETRICALRNDTSICESEDRAHHLSRKSVQRGSGGNV